MPLVTFGPPVEGMDLVRGPSMISPTHAPLIINWQCEPEGLMSMGGLVEAATYSNYLSTDDWLGLEIRPTHFVSLRDASCYAKLRANPYTEVNILTAAYLVPAPNAPDGGLYVMFGSPHPGSLTALRMGRRAIVAGTLFPHVIEAQSLYPYIGLRPVGYPYYFSIPNPTQGNVTIATSGGALNGATINEAGQFWSKTPAYDLVGAAGGSAGTISFTMKLKSINIKDPGQYADDAVYNLVFAGGGGGAGAAGTATVAGGHATSITITNHGSGYTTVPTCSINYTGTGTPVNAKLGVFCELAAVTATGGTGYSGSYQMVFKDGGGPGAYCEVSSAGGNMTGSGYEYAFAYRLKADGELVWEGPLSEPIALSPAHSLTNGAVDIYALGVHGAGSHVYPGRWEQWELGIWRGNTANIRFDTMPRPTHLAIYRRGNSVPWFQLAGEWQFESGVVWPAEGAVFFTDTKADSELGVLAPAYGPVPRGTTVRPEWYGFCAVAEYQNRLWVGSGEYLWCSWDGDIDAWSSDPDPVLPTSGMVFDFSVQGESVRGMEATDYGLVVWTEKQMWIIEGTDATSFTRRHVADSGLAAYGCHCRVGTAVYWLSMSGVNRWQYGGEPQRVSQSLGERFRQEFNLPTTQVGQMLRYRDHLWVKVPPPAGGYSQWYVMSLATGGWSLYRYSDAPDSEYDPVFGQDPESGDVYAFTVDNPVVYLYDRWGAAPILPQFYTCQHHLGARDRLKYVNRVHLRLSRYAMGDAPVSPTAHSYRVTVLNEQNTSQGYGDMSITFTPDSLSYDVPVSEQSKAFRPRGGGMLVGAKVEQRTTSYGGVLFTGLDMDVTMRGLKRNA